MAPPRLQHVRRHDGLRPGGVPGLPRRSCRLLEAAGVTGVPHEAGYVSAVLFLIPGFPLVTGFLDLAKMDFSAGVARLTYAVMVLTSAALAVWALSLVVGPDARAGRPPRDLGAGVLLALRFVASFVGVLGFALMFNSPWRIALAAAVIGMVANVPRIYLIGAGDAPAGRRRAGRPGGRAGHRRRGAAARRPADHRLRAGRDDHGARRARLPGRVPHLERATPSRRWPPGSRRPSSSRRSPSGWPSPGC